MIKLKIELIHPNAKIPIKASKKAACWDVFAADIKRESKDFYIVDLGFKLQPPPGYKVVLVPRSSITKTYLIVQNSPGQGDEDYTGTYQYRFRMLPNGIMDIPEDQWGIMIQDHITGKIIKPFPSR
jgi:dUTPase